MVFYKKDKLLCYKDMVFFVDIFTKKCYNKAIKESENI